MPNFKKNNLRFTAYWLIHPAALAVYFTILLYFYTYNNFQPFKIDLIKENVLAKNEHVYFQDLNGDGTTEMIQVGYSASGDKDLIRVQYKTLEGVIINQWNIKGKLLSRPDVTFGDFNNNNSKEIYIISRVADSLFLNVKELYSRNGFDEKKIFI